MRCYLLRKSMYDVEYCVLNYFNIKFIPDYGKN